MDKSLMGRTPGGKLDDLVVLVVVLLLLLGGGMFSMIIRWSMMGLGDQNMFIALLFI